MVHVRGHIDEFEKRDCRVLGITAEDPELIFKYLKYHEFPFTVLNDGERRVIRSYGIAQETRGSFGTIAWPANMLLDGGGIIRYLFIGQQSSDFPPDELLYEEIDRI